MVAIISKFTYIELFAGIGGFRQALDELGGNCVFASEIDKYAAQSYEAIYGDKPAGDITKIAADDIPDHDVLVGGFPCQAFSVAGQRKGFEDTRGTLFFEIARIAAEKKPRLLLLENVKGLISHDNGNTLDVMCRTLNDIGYAIDFRVLNSKYFGVPQNRERIFIVADRDAPHEPWNLGKATDVVTKARRRLTEQDVRTFNFAWPESEAVTVRLRDILEQAVDERYYLSEEKTAKLVAQLGDKTLVDTSDCDMLGMVDLRGNDSIKRVYSPVGISPTLTTMGGGHREPKIAEPVSGLAIREATVKGYAVAEEGDAVNVQFPESSTRRGRVGKQIEASGINQGVVVIGNTHPSGRGMNGNVYDSRALCPTLTTNSGDGLKVTELQEYSDGSGLAYCVDANYAKGSSPGDIGKGRRTHVIEADEITVNIVGRADIPGHDYNKRIYSDTGLARCLNTASDIGRSMKVAIEVRPVLTPDREEKRQNGRRFKDDGEESFTLTAQDKHGIALGSYPRYRIRKLTPRECWRLQGFSDSSFDRAKAAGVSDSQLYKQAGNAVTVNVIAAISKPLIARLQTEG